MAELSGRFTVIGMDQDKPHPAATSAEIERLAPNLEVQKDWRAPTHLAESIRRVTDFLTRHPIVGRGLVPRRSLPVDVEPAGDEPPPYGRHRASFRGTRRGRPNHDAEPP
jgi:hypothetical protein